MLLNSVILRVAFEWKLPVIDSRLVCLEPSDDANAIEPSSEGAAKIAQAIASSLGMGSDAPSSTTVYFG